MQKLSDLPMGKALVDGAQQLRERLDELATRIRAIDPLEKRVTALEERVEALEKKSKPKPSSRRPKQPAEAEDRELGHAQAQRPRQDFEADGRRPGLLAVELDGQRHVGVDARRPRRAAAPPSGAAGASRGRSSAACSARSVFVMSPMRSASSRPSSGSASGQIFMPPPK